MSKAHLRAELSRLQSEASELRKIIKNDKEDLRKLKNGLSTIKSEEQEFNSNKRKVDDIDISTNDWRGNERTKYDDKFDELKTTLNGVKKDIETIVTSIEKDIIELEQKIQMNGSSLSSIVQRISHVESQIRSADDE